MRQDGGFPKKYLTMAQLREDEVKIPLWLLEHYSASMYGNLYHTHHGVKPGPQQSGNRLCAQKV